MNAVIFIISTGIICGGLWFIIETALHGLRKSFLADVSETV